MKLSERLKEMDLSRINGIYNSITLTSERLIQEIQELEEKAANWGMLERLPDEHGIYRDDYVYHEHKKPWDVFVYEYGCGSMNVNGLSCADTPADALKKYWEGK